MGYLSYFVMGGVLGALSWAVCPVVSGQFEPFDTLIGFVIGQALMLAFAIYTGWTKRVMLLFLLVAGMYVGQNVYAYIFSPAFGSSDTREWFLLGLVTSVFLCILPLVGGGVARWIVVCSQRARK
ncbi:hypothetical protein ACFO0U_02450 [Chromohalobacter sarecensis]|uniref:Uncharacterized protein n=1 Tax=Chromohalobacter sarecensis TaxID=245294 RepID=A0ABV9CY99_9GAMM|nr:hypothetical protein [Chromohalobacter sarecensis]MCK0714781.1 hypothetical protein [Chromohalobacter sarecensis]